MKVDLDDDQRACVLAILTAHVPNAEVWAYGSRVLGKPRKHADLDLVVIGKNSLPMENMQRLIDAFDDSGLAFVVDVHDWHRMPENFKNEIAQKHLVMQQAK